MSNPELDAAAVEVPPCTALADAHELRDLTEPVSGCVEVEGFLFAWGEWFSHLAYCTTGTLYRQDSVPLGQYPVSLAQRRGVSLSCPRKALRSR